MPSSSLEVKSFSATSGDDSLEELLLPNSTIAIEHDLTSLYRPLKEGCPQPGPMPLGIAVVSNSVLYDTRFHTAKFANGLNINSGINQKVYE